MYSKLNSFNGTKNIRKIGREFNKLIHTRGGKYSYNPQGTAILDEDWDNLIILDACRYDTFAQLADLPGQLESRYSRGSATYNFIRANFTDTQAHDIVYVSANAWFLKLRDEINSEIHKFIDLQHGDREVNWAHKDLNVVTPETVTEAALDADDMYPQKRLIIHYLQPHHPFIGPTGQEHFTQQSSSLIDVVDVSNCSDQLLHRAYNENLTHVLSEARKLLTSLQGKTIITSDHGEMLGDRHDYVPTKDYGHHKGIFNNATVKVPWLVYTHGNRKSIKPERPPDTGDVDMSSIDKRLRDLGYKVD